MPPKKKQRLETAITSGSSDNKLCFLSAAQSTGLGPAAPSVLSSEQHGLGLGPLESQVLNLATSVNPTPQASQFLDVDGDDGPSLETPCALQSQKLDVGDSSSESDNDEGRCSQHLGGGGKQPPLMSQVLPLGSADSSQQAHPEEEDKTSQNNKAKNTKKVTQTIIYSGGDPPEGEAPLSSSQIIALGGDDSGSSSSEGDGSPALLRVGSKRGRPSLTIDRSQSSQQTSQTQSGSAVSPLLMMPSSTPPAAMVAAAGRRGVHFKSQPVVVATAATQSTDTTSESNTQSTNGTTASVVTPSPTARVVVVRPTLGGGGVATTPTTTAEERTTTTNIEKEEAAQRQLEEAVQVNYCPPTIDAPLPTSVLGSYIALSGQGLRVDRAWVSTMYTVAQRALNHTATGPSSTGISLLSPEESQK